MSHATLDNFLDLFDLEEMSIVETLKELRLTITSNLYKELLEEQLLSKLSFLNSRDKLHLSYTIDEGEPIDFYSNFSNEDFFKQLKNKTEDLKDESLKIAITITKQELNGVVSVYSYVDFISYLNNLSLSAIIVEFHGLLQKSNVLILESQKDEPISKTQTIWFVNKDHFGKPDLIARDTIIDKAKSVCHYNLLSQYFLVPDDFSLVISNCEDLKKMFNRLTTALSIAYLYDITTIDKDLLTFRLNGYKAISSSIEFKTIKSDPENQYFKIYEWVYNSGNFTDKIGLARNIISLHLSDQKSIELKGDSFQSIQSSYKVYEKQNIKQYIEIRNKISDQLLSFHDRANKIIETFASGFQKSAFALITFYISAIILKVLNKDTLIDVFTIDTSILSTAFIFCSAIYFFISKWEVNAQRDRFENNYADVKKRYTDLLDEQDICRILNNDHEFKSDLNFIKDKGNIYTLMWFIVLGVFLISTWTLYFLYHPITFDWSKICLCNIK